MPRVSLCQWKARYVSAPKHSCGGARKCDPTLLMLAIPSLCVLIQVRRIEIYLSAFFFHNVGLFKTHFHLGARNFNRIVLAC
jgi:hypothetical protein